MKFFTVAASAAVVGMATAQMDALSEIPQCALSCFTNTIAKSSCDLTDFYCQCGKEVKEIQTKTLDCLCHSECTTNDLAKVLKISTQICTKALEDHGEKYSPPMDMVSQGICNKGDAPSGGAAKSNGTSSSNSTGTSSSSGSSSSSSGSDFEGAASSGMGMSMGAIALGGLAYLAL